MIEEQREQERQQHQGQQRRVAFFGRYAWGPTDVVRGIFMGLHEAGHTVYEFDVGERPELLDNPRRRSGGYGPVFVKLDAATAELNAFQPEVVVLCAGGLTFSPRDFAALKERCLVAGMTLSDPDVYPSIVEYAGEFDVHTTNSELALGWYKQAGQANVHLLPFAVSSELFVPVPPDPAFETDVAVIGDARSDRLEVAGRLVRDFGAKLYGRNWTPPGPGPVVGADWFKAAYSTRCLVNFARTRAGFTNVKVGVFEGTATGRLMMAERFDEMRRYFKYDAEIVGYSTIDDLTDRLRHYLDHPAELEAVAHAGQLRCRAEHIWANRIRQMFAELAGIDRRVEWRPLA